MILLVPSSAHDRSLRVPFYSLYWVSLLSSLFILAVFCFGRLQRHFTIKYVSHCFSSRGLMKVKGKKRRTKEGELSRLLRSFPLFSPPGRFFLSKLTLHPTSSLCLALRCLGHQCDLQHHTVRPKIQSGREIGEVEKLHCLVGLEGCEGSASSLELQWTLDSPREQDED